MTVPKERHGDKDKLGALGKELHINVLIVFSGYLILKEHFRIVNCFKLNLHQYHLAFGTALIHSDNAELLQICVSEDGWTIEGHGQQKCLAKIKFKFIFNNNIY